MALFAGPQEHAANPPETWEVVRVADRLWHVRPAGADHAITTATTRREALRLTVEGFYYDLYQREARWYAGETVHPWRPYAEIAAERERREARAAAAGGIR